GRSPNSSVVQELSQFGITCAVEVCPRRQLAPVRRGLLNKLPLLQPATRVFQHVDTFGPAPSQSPGEQGFKHRRAILQGLIVDKHYLFKARPSIDYFFEDRISDYSRTINSGNDPEPVVQQCMFKVPFQDFARADGQE